MSDSETDTGYVLPNLEFEFVEVPKDSDSANEQNQQSITEIPVVESTEESPQVQDEIFFPLFAGTTKVSLKEEDEVSAIKQERPESYYIASYTAQQLEEFKISAISYDMIFQSFDNRYKNSKVIDLNEYNKQFDKAKKRAKRRPSLKARRNRIEGKKNVKLRLKQEKEAEKIITKVINQKKKRGGKKNKKKQTNLPKPKYRTE